MSQAINTDLAFVDNSTGQAVALGTSYWGEPYQDPETDPKTPYSDLALTTAVSATQSLTSAGKPEQSLYLSGAYSLRVRDAAGNIVIDEEYVVGLGGSASHQIIPSVADLYGNDWSHLSRATTQAFTAGGEEGGAEWIKTGTGGTPTTSGTLYSNGLSSDFIVDQGGNIWTLIEGQIRTPEIYGAVGDGVASGGVFSGTDDTDAIQAWMNNNKELHADPTKVYVVGNLTLPHHSGSDIHLCTDVTFAFADCADTSYGMADQYHLANSTSVMRGPKTGSHKWTLYGNDHVTTSFIGCFFDADAHFACSRALGDGFTLSALRANGSTSISGTAVDNRLKLEFHDNDDDGFRLVDSAANKITDGQLDITIAEGQGGYDVNMDGAAGWFVNVHRNYSSAGGVYIGKASAGTHVHFGQGDSGDASPSGTSGWGFYVSDIITSNLFDQASGFVKLTGHLNFAVSCGGLSSGSGARGIDASGLHLNTTLGYFLLSQSNSAIRIKTNHCIMSEESWTSVYTTSASGTAPFRFSSSAITARYEIENTLVSAIDCLVDNMVINGGGIPELTISSGAITVGSGRTWLVDTESDAASDDLDTINGGYYPGQQIVLRPASGARTVVVKDGTGNLSTAGDFSMDNGGDCILLEYTGSSWIQVSRGDNGA